MGRLLVALLTLSTWIYEVAAAEIVLLRDNPCGFRITGDIAPGDDETFRERVLEAFDRGCQPHMLELFSPGGNLQAAIGIGRQVSVLGLYTKAPEAWAAVSARSTWRCNLRGKIVEPYDKATGRGDRNCICASACFFIWAAGAKRMGNVVAIHRPHFDPKYYAGLSLSESRRQYQEMNKAAEKYLVEMDVPASLIARMMSINSREGAFLTASEVQVLRTRQFYDELLIAHCGMSEAEEEARAQKAMKGFSAKTTFEHFVRRLEVSKEYIECYSRASRQFGDQAKADYLSTFGHR